MWYFVVIWIRFFAEFNMSGAPLTGDEERFMRLARILLDDVPTHLRATFKAKFQARFNFTWGENRTSGEFFVANFSAPRTPRHVTDVIRHGITQQFDSTALFTCLLFSGTGILLPTPRRGTRTYPFQDSERIDQLRMMRNELAHATSASLSLGSFRHKIASLNTIYAQLHWNPTLMRQWARAPVATAECVRLQQQLSVERQRYISLDGTVQALGQSVQGIEQRLQGLEGTVQDHEQRMQHQEGKLCEFNAFVIIVCLFYKTILYNSRIARESST